MRRIAFVVALAASGAWADAYDGIVRRVAEADGERAARQARLVRRASLGDYRAKVVTVRGTNVWTRALQAALDENEIVVIPAASEPYLIDAPVLLPSNRRIEAVGATVALLPGTRTLMLRNANCPDGTCAPVAGKRDDNIAIVGGRWEDWMRGRSGYGGTGRFDMSERRHGNWFGVSTLFYFGNCDHVTVEDVTFAHTSAFSVQAGDGDAHGYRNIAFDDCYADGLHLNGNLTRVHVANARGKVGDDLVALNAYDWLNSSVNFGPQKDVLCEDLELVLKGGKGYPAIRIQPAKYRYADGSVVDCAVSDVVFRRVKGIVTFKMYLQTPKYRIGEKPEWAEVGSGGNLWFEDIEIDLSRPIDMLEPYVRSDALRGHFGAFEFGANLTDVNFRNVDIRFHLDKWPLSHLAVVGPKSVRYGDCEVFDPYVDCRVGRVTVEGLVVCGEQPRELVRTTVFDDINGDGRSSGKGVIECVDIRTAGDVITDGKHEYRPENYVEPTDPLVREELGKFRDRKLGLMMHFGPYSQLGINESWPLVDDAADRWSRRLVDWTEGEDFKRQYLEMWKSFNPVRIQPERWAAIAKRNGFRYLVFTAKHHDGFCLYDSKFSDFKVTNPLCPFSRNPKADIVRHVFDAFRAEGLAISCYFSKPDWHHPDYWDNCGLGYRTTNRPSYDVRKDPARWERFAAFTKNQLLELVRDYGPLDSLWLDGGQVARHCGLDIHIEDIVTEARKIRPGLVSIDRVGGGMAENVVTPEQTVPPKPMAVPWETCATMGTGWSYRYDDTYKSPRELIHLLIEVVSKNGNLALNVAPGPDGRLPQPAIDRLDAIGAWLRANGEAIYATRGCDPYWTGMWAFTRGKDGAAYAIRLWREGDRNAVRFAIPKEFDGSGVRRIVHLASGREIPFERTADGLLMRLPREVETDPYADAFRLERKVEQ